MMHLSLLAQVLDHLQTPMEHRHLWLAYAAVWTLQFGYATWVALKWANIRRGAK
jgi:hypothetical protein